MGDSLGAAAAERQTDLRAIMCCLGEQSGSGKTQKCGEEENFSSESLQRKISWRRDKLPS